MKRGVAIILFTVTYGLAFCQTIDYLDDAMYKSRVKLVDEFFDRFNGKEDNPQISPNDPDARKKNICYLFNSDYIKRNGDTITYEALAFADTVMETKVSINYEDASWYAKATCVGKMKEKESTFTLYLAVENRRDDLYKWVITRAEGDIFKLSPSSLSERIMLMPDEHETKFMSLYRITTQKDDLIVNYSQKDFNVDETSVFYSMVYYGLLDIDYVKDVEYVFLQVPGYAFSIREIENETFNAGWLIDSLSKMSDEEKMETLNYVYNVHRAEPDDTQEEISEVCSEIDDKSISEESENETTQMDK